MKDLSFYDQCRSHAMQRQINHVHVINWICDRIPKTDVPNVLRALIKECKVLHIDIDFNKVKLALERERLLNYDNSDYFMNGVICANNDGTAHYPSQELGMRFIK